jgi:hypothetical protein
VWASSLSGYSALVLSAFLSNVLSPGGIAD